MSDQPIQMSSGLPTTVLPEPEPGQRDELAQAVASDDPGSAIATFVGRHPRSLAGWSALGDQRSDVIDRYAAYRVGYHRGLDALRANGWRGSGYVRWSAPGNRDFLRCLLGLHLMATAIGEGDEADRCAQFLQQLDPNGVPADEFRVAAARLMAARAPVGVVLTGGASRRMGVDKAVMVVDGRPMAVRVADALWGAGCRPVWCQGGDLAALAELGLEGFADDAPGDGPLAAVVAALRHAGGADAVIAACDLVDLDAAAVTAVIDAATADADVVVARAHGRDHLLGWWSADAVDRVGALVDDGTRSLREAYASLRVARVEVPPERVRNANRPDDVEA